MSKVGQLVSVRSLTKGVERSYRHRDYGKFNGTLWDFPHLVLVFAGRLV